MSNQRYDQFVYSLIKKPVKLSGVISLSAAGAIVSSDIAGVLSVVHTGVGIYTLTLRSSYPGIKAVHCNIAETAQNLDAKPGAVDVSIAKTVVINTRSAGTLTDPTATCKIYVTLILTNSSVPSKG